MNRIRLATDNYTFFFVSVANMLRKEQTRVAFLEALETGFAECIIEGTYFGSLKINITDLKEKQATKFLICNLVKITRAVSEKISTSVGGELNSEVKIDESGYIFDFKIEAYVACEEEVLKLKDLLALDQDSAVFHRNVQLKISVS